MQYKALILDVDGTLLAHGEPTVRPQVAQAVKAAQKKGIKIVIATGRTHFSISPAVLGGIKPDYAVCANGAQLLDKSGRVLASQTFTPEEMYALVDYCEDFDAPLSFCYEDHYYAYVEYTAIRDFYHAATGHGEYMLDGQDQDRHLQSMPFGAFAVMPLQHLQGFARRYGYLGLQFVPYRPGYYDVMQAGMDKAVGVKKLLERTGWTPDALISIGDNDNDVQLMQLAGRSYCMENGSQNAKTAAGHIAPSVLESGVAAVIKEVLL